MPSILFDSLFIVALLGSVIPIPTEPPIIALLRRGAAPEAVSIVLAFGSIIGAMIGYSIGRYGLARLGIFHIRNREREAKVREWFQSHGETFLIASAWIPLIGDLAPVVVGIEKYDWKKFLVVISIAKALKSVGTVYIISLALAAI